MPPDNNETLEDEALVWLARMTSGEFGLAQERELERWLAQGENRRRALAEAFDLWQALGRLQDSKVIARYLDKNDEAGADSKNLPATLKAGPKQPKPAGKKRTSQWAPLAVAACLIVLVGWLNPYAGIQPWLADYRTAIGARETVKLADGSRIYLNSGSALNTRYTPETRRVELISGEAEFVVGKNPGRPFIVTAGGHEIKALGTEFIVRKQSREISVTVVESAVQVEQPDYPFGAVVLHPGEQVRAAAGQRPGAVVPVNLEKVRAWRDNRLVFESEPLDKVVEEINRYRPGRVILVDKTLAAHRVSGVFDIDRIDRILAVISQTLPVKSAGIGNYVMLY